MVNILICTLKNIFYVYVEFVDIYILACIHRYMHTLYRMGYRVPFAL